MNIHRKQHAIRTLKAAMAVGLASTSYAQDTDPEQAEAEEAIEEIIVVGSQIRGADISGNLPVTVIDAEDIEALGASSGDELFEMLPEQGQNFFNEEENISGGVNSARGDVGAFNLRNLGTGNTLVLLNGRRLVNAASYQTEEVGGSFVPVNTVNSNTIPVFGLKRIELLKDGASAIYGADAVAGVVNTVLESDLEGLMLRGQFGSYSNISRNTRAINIEWGALFNEGRTNVSMLIETYDRGRVSSHEDERWADSDFRRLVPENSPWSDSLAFRNNSANSLYGQFDVISSVRDMGLSGEFTDSSGEFEVYPAGDSRCQWEINEFTCGAVDGQGTYRYNLNEVRDLSSDLMRKSVFLYVNHAFDNGMELFSEWLHYSSGSEISRHPSTPFSSVKLRVAAENYYNPFGRCGSPNRLPEELIPDVPCSGLTLEIDNYRFAEVPRIVQNDGTVGRMLVGLRGSLGDWDWESAILKSEAKRKDLTRNRVSNILIVEALSDPTEAAYNPFSGGVNSNIERALVDVVRQNQMGLYLWDARLSTINLYNLPAGPMGAVIGLEVRREEFRDDRDDRLDGTIIFTDFQGNTYPFVSDVVNSSPTPDGSGARTVRSLFAELYTPIISRVDAQVAARYESFSDVENPLVGKFAIGWRAHDKIQLRASWSEAFRAPNLVTINEEIVARQNTRSDYVCVYAAERGGDPDQDVLDCVNSIQRIARGSALLKSERSTNYSLGTVVDAWEDLTFTLDYWSIEKKDTIGLFGEENHTVYDLLLRLNHGSENCAAANGNPAIVRSSDIDSDVAEIYRAAGLCPVGDLEVVSDLYANLDTRTTRGLDFGIHWETQTDFGRFKVRLLSTFLQTFEQEPGGVAAELVAAKDAGMLPASIPVAGFADLIGRDGNQDVKQTLLVTWRHKHMGASLSGTYLGDFYQNSLTLDDGTRYWVGTMRAWNASSDYRFDLNEGELRLRASIRNLFNERAPLADRYFGFLSDAHRDYGRSFYLEARFVVD